MLHKTRGIVFRFTRYGETSIIVNIFTELFGLQGYIVNGVRSQSIRSKIALYQPLTLLDLVVYHRENANLLRIKEAKCLHQYTTIHQDIHKSAVAMFLNEVINKAVRDQSHAEELCEFLIQSFTTLDRIKHAENFHLIFLLRLSRLLGFGPQSTGEVLGGFTLAREEEDILRQLLNSEYDQETHILYTQRKNLLDCLMRFYSMHIDNLGEIRSVEVLKDVLN